LSSPGEESGDDSDEDGERRDDGGGDEEEGEDFGDPDSPVSICFTLFSLAHSSFNSRSEIDHHHRNRRSFSLLATAFRKISAHLRMRKLNLQRNWPN
jgi:hypothetical protein